MKCGILRELEKIADRNICGWEATFKLKEIYQIVINLTKTRSKGVEEMDKEKALIQIQNEISFTKNEIEELTKEGRDIDKIFYQGVLQAYENMNNWFKNND
jgi:hypothetical protein